MTEVRAELGNVNELHAVVASPGDAFAFYLYRNNQRVEKTGYSASNAKRFVLRERGTYVVKGYSRTDGDRGVSGMSNRVTFSGIPTIPRRTATRNLIVFGVSTVSAFAALLLGRKHNVAGIFDPTGNFDGQKFHGQQIFAEIPHGFDLVAFEQYDAGVGKLETFSLVAGRDDILSQSIDTLGRSASSNFTTSHKPITKIALLRVQAICRVSFASSLLAGSQTLSKLTMGRC